MTGAVAGWRRLRGAHLVVRLVLLLMPVLALLPVPGPTSWWQVVVGLLLGVLACRRPDSLIGLGVLVLVGWRWAAVDGSSVPGSVLASVAALVAFEVASVLASYGPPELRLEPALLRLWAVRAVVLLAPALVVLLAAQLVEDARGTAPLWFLGAATAVVSLVALRSALGLSEAEAED